MSVVSHYLGDCSFSKIVVASSIATETLARSGGSQLSTRYTGDHSDFHCCLFLFSHALQSGDVKLLRSQEDLILEVKPVSWSSSLDLTLQEVPTYRLKQEMSTLLFLLWDKLHTTTEKLHGTN